MMFVQFDLAYGGTIVVNPSQVYLIEEVADGVRIYLAPGEGKKNFTLKDRSAWAVAQKLSNEK